MPQTARSTPAACSRAFASESRTPDVRSTAWHLPSLRPRWLATATRLGAPEYAVLKLADVLFSAELGRRLAGSGVHPYAVHPGVVACDLWRGMPWPVRPVVKALMISAEQGAATSLYCASSAPAAGQTGLYYDKCRAVRTSQAGADTALAAELWRRSQTWVRG